MSEETLPLKEQVKMDLYLDFRDLLSRIDQYARVKIPPNRIALQSSFFLFYVQIKSKLEKSIEQKPKKYSKFEEIKEYMEDKKTVASLNLDKCQEFTFLLAEYLEMIGVA